MTYSLRQKKSNEEIGCTCLVVLALWAAVLGFIYWIAYNVAEYFGINGWIGVGILILVSFVAGSMKASASRSD